MKSTSITPEERAEWLKDGDTRIARLLGALERAELLRDSATAVVENEQGRIAMYIGKYEEALREKEKIARQREAAIRERDWLASSRASIADSHGLNPAESGHDAAWWIDQARQATGTGTGEG